VREEIELAGSPASAWERLIDVSRAPRVGEARERVHSPLPCSRGRAAWPDHTNLAHRAALQRAPADRDGWGGQVQWTWFDAMHNERALPRWRPEPIGRIVHMALEFTGVLDMAKERTVVRRLSDPQNGRPAR